MTITVKARGDGNCAFNAYALSLCHLIISGKLDTNTAQDRHSSILTLFRLAFPTSITSATDWNGLKTFIKSFQGDKKRIETELEKKLSKVLREFSADAILQNKIYVDQAFYIDSTQNGLLGAFDQFCKLEDLRKDAVKNKKAIEKIEKEADDIFITHDFIAQKFKTLYSDSRLTEQQKKDELKRWWTTAGEWRKFVENMKQDGRQSGELELGILLDFLELGLVLFRKNQVPTNLTPSHLAGQPEIMVRFENGHYNLEIHDDQFKDWLLCLNETAHKVSASKKDGTRLFTAAVKTKLEKVFDLADSSNKEIKEVDLDKLPAVIEYAAGTFEIDQKSKNSYTFGTDDEDPEFLKQMVEKLKETLSAIDSNIDNWTIEIDSENPEVKKQLFDLCEDEDLPVLETDDEVENENDEDAEAQESYSNKNKDKLKNKNKKNDESEENEESEEEETANESNQRRAFRS